MNLLISGLWAATMALINIDNLEDAVGSIYNVKHIDTRT